MSKPATKNDLDQAMTQLRGEMGDMEGRLRGEMGDMEGRLRGEMRAMEDRLVRTIDQSTAQVANVMVEQFRPYLAAFDEKYKDFPGRHQALRDDFDAHAADFRLHTRLSPAPAKRARRPRTP
jgi:hypothetical protein